MRVEAQARAIRTGVARANTIEVLRPFMEQAVEMRNAALLTTRKNITGLARVLSRYLKEEGLTVPQLISKYTPSPKTSEVLCGPERPLQ